MYYNDGKTAVITRGSLAMDVKVSQTTISLVQGDITGQTTDAIVNAANSSLMGGGGVDGAIHRAGGPAILAECKQIVAKQGRLPAGKAVITTGGNLKAKYVIHTVGPVWGGGNGGEAEILASAYTESLRLAEQHKLTSISFPSISTGAYRYPLSQAARVAVGAVVKFAREEAESIRKIVFVLFDMKSYSEYETVLTDISNIK
jgi:O-acetyl-ADP-ribose deacetylase (regulator of RNase III)